MKLVVVSLMLAVMLAGCGNSLKGQDGKIYECYGIIDKDDVKDPNIRYKLVTDNIIWDVILVETVVVPIWLLGFQTHCPVEAK